MSGERGGKEDYQISPSPRHEKVCMHFLLKGIVSRDFLELRMILMDMALIQCWALSLTTLSLIQHCPGQCFACFNAVPDNP